MKTRPKTLLTAALSVGALALLLGAAAGSQTDPLVTMSYLNDVNAPAILSNGATVFDYREQRLVRRTYLPYRVIEDMMDVCAVFPQLGFEAYYQNEIFVFRPNANHTQTRITCSTDSPIPPRAPARDKSTSKPTETSSAA